jgi:preprotein translocase subunit YajC
MLVSPAFAQSAAPAAGIGAGLESFLPLVLIFVVFYFLMIRPQQKRMKQHKEMLSQLRRGDRVVTSGGIVGTVSKVLSDTEVLVEIAEGVRVRVMRQTIQDIVSKTEPVAAGKEEDKADAETKSEPANDK